MINKEYILSKAIDLTKEIHGHDASGHDFHHILRVVKMAEHLAQVEKSESVDLFLVRLASYLHDIDDPKLSDGKVQRLAMFLQNTKSLSIIKNDLSISLITSRTLPS